MARYGVQTSLGLDDAIVAAVSYFGDGGIGLRARTKGSCCVRFEGGGGFVHVTATPGDTTMVVLETRESDCQVKEFMAQVRGLAGTGCRQSHLER